MRLYSAACILGALAEHALAADSPRPRGVGPEFAKFYKGADAFTCISNPTIRLSPAQINDDFCDCPDGSDEPGTSACAHLSPLSPQLVSSPSSDAAYNTTPALPGFYCKNKNHNPTYIPFTYVNDGHCDYSLCCDGSDEWAGVGGVKCEDRCKKIGQDWRAADAKRQISLTTAGKRRAELVSAAQKARKEAEDYLRSSVAELEAAEQRAASLEKEKDEVEKREKSKVVRKQGSGGKVAVLAGLAKDKITELKDALTHVKRQRDEAKVRTTELETILAKFREEYNPNFNDEGVKRAVRAWDDYAARDKGDSPENDAKERDITNLSTEDDTIPWDDLEADDATAKTDIEALYAFEEYLPESLKAWLDTQLRALRQFLVDNGLLSASPASTTSAPSDSPALKAAREALAAAQKDAEAIRTKRSDHETDLAKDYGPADVFRTLKGACVSKDAGEYTYELCWMGAVTQKPKKGGMNNNMGNFARFDTVVADEDVGADGRGLGVGERVAARHEGGAGCWQGPQRSTTVVMACAETEEIWKVIEEEKCVYRLEVGTPAVCEPPAGATKEQTGEVPPAGGKDEL